MAIRKFSEKKLTDAVIRSIRRTKNPRLKQVMASFIKHLHSFVRDVKPTQEEWMRGIEFLTTTQKPDGTWYEDLATGTGFPNVFYLQYTLYRNYFPVLALTQARRALAPKPTWVQPLAAT